VLQLCVVDATSNTLIGAVEMQPSCKSSEKRVATWSVRALPHKIPPRCLCYSNTRSINSTSYLHTKCGVLRVEVSPSHAKLLVIVCFVRFAANAVGGRCSRTTVAAVPKSRPLTDLQRRGYLTLVTVFQPAQRYHISSFTPGTILCSPRSAVCSSQSFSTTRMQTRK
jgi:hypothetical protein